MKGAILILILCTASICTRAQQIDKKLLIGRWDLYAMREGTITVYRDSMAKNTKSLLLYKIGLDATKCMTADDSLAMSVRMRTELEELFTGYAIFDGNEGVRMFLPFGDPKYKAETGKYFWIKNNQISQVLGISHPKTITILSLTDTELDILYNTEGLSMVFTRAK